MNQPIQNIKRHDYQKFLNWFGNSGAKETVIKVNGHIKSCVRDAMEEQLIPMVFYSPTSQYRIISNASANKLLKKLLEDLSIKQITVHGLRHTHASVLLYQKASIHYVSERLGHSDIETTLKAYTHVLKELRLQDEKVTVETFENMIV